MGVLVRVTRVGYNRVVGGTLVRHKVGAQLEVSERELTRFGDRLEMVGEDSIDDVPAREVHDLNAIGAALVVGDASAPSQGHEADAGGESTESVAGNSAAGSVSDSQEVEQQREARLEREQRIARVKAAGDVQALRMLAFEWGIDVSNRWKEDRTRQVILDSIGD